jgi:hypothetical protein
MQEVSGSIPLTSTIMAKNRNDLYDLTSFCTATDKAAFSGFFVVRCRFLLLFSRASCAAGLSRTGGRRLPDNQAASARRAGAPP